ncbi:MAG: cobalamin biosynthesis protein CobW [Hydrogenophilales bacterium 28-61-23]|nr:MAG: cobalamin biosynthesis protein CobW [Hydrogenophilales bacterium 28-61-23]
MTSPELLPVTLLTGFLGSGKTTVLNHLLRHLPLTAVVMNEFGEIGLDHQLLEESRGPLALLSGGCVCCQIQGTLAPTLKNLLMSRASGTLPPFERIVIETTGIADPAPILQTLLAERWLAARLKMDGVVTTVDAVFGAQQLEAHPEAERQAAVADRLLLTKTDLATPGQIESLTARLAELNPAAPVYTVLNGQIDPERVTHLGLFDPNNKHPDVLRWLAHQRYKPAARAPLGGVMKTQAKVEQTASHDARIRAFSLSFDEPLDWLGVQSALEMLQAFRAQNLLRMKALVNVKGKPNPVVLHAVQHMLYPPAELPAWPDDDRRSRFVFITSDLDEAFVAKLLEDFTQAALA